VLNAGRALRPAPQQVRLHVLEVSLHGRDGLLLVPGQQGLNEPDVLLLVGHPPLLGVVAHLQAAPDLPLAGLLHDVVGRDEQLIATGRNDRVMQGEVPHLELSGILRPRTALQAAAHFVEVTSRRPAHDQREDMRLDQPARSHDIGRADLSAPLHRHADSRGARS
jgi:hypothetical protein